MSPLTTSNSLLDLLQIQVFANTYLNSKRTRPRLKMIWLKEFDGKCERLFAKWISED